MEGGSRKTVPTALRNFSKRLRAPPESKSNHLEIASRFTLERKRFILQVGKQTIVFPIAIGTALGETSQRRDRLSHGDISTAGDSTKAPNANLIGLRVP